MKATRKIDPATFGAAMILTLDRSENPDKLLALLGKATVGAMCNTEYMHQDGPVLRAIAGTFFELAEELQPTTNVTKE